MNRRGWIDRWVTAGLAGVLISCMPFVFLPGWRRVGQALQKEPDPSYEIYQRYRYAYEKYGYLFSLSEAKPEPQAKPEPPVQAEKNEGSLSSVRLYDYDTLMDQFYSVHPSTTAPAELMSAERFLGEKLTLKQESAVPQILIYHTHSQEEYADFGPGNPGATVVEAGNYLTLLLQKKGWNVIHDTTAYDKKGGKLDRNRAYSYALEGITQILQQYPSIQVIIDLHRDGVDSRTRLISVVHGKETARIMFFQGMSRTPEREIAYLPNPYLPQNLAFSFQMQFLAAKYYPGFTRKIYMKGLRYNLHLRPRSTLVEVGAQTNTILEAKRAMEPLAEVFDMVLREETNNGMIYSD